MKKKTAFITPTPLRNRFLEQKLCRELTNQIWPYVVKRPHGGCQILFPLTALDRLVEKAVKEAHV